MIISGGVAVKAPDQIVWSGSPSSWGNSALQLASRWASYSALYRSQIWVRVLVDKRALLLARLPLKVYRRDELDRPEVPDHPYAKLLAYPNERQSRYAFWLWMQSMFDIYGEAFAGKVRDAGGRPTQLIPMHPTAMKEREESNGRVLWDFDNGKVSITGIPDEDLFHPRNFNPDSFTRGLSKLESLRATLENEDAALRSQSSFWRNGARPGVVLTHPSLISQKAADRLKLSWEAVTAGADNFGRTVVLEEGMKPEIMSLSAEEAQYIEARKLNREEVIAAYDMPPPVVHVLDHATFSNIVEQMRSVYRDTIEPITAHYQSDLETQLRGSRRRGGDEPDFGDDVYAEFLLDGVLRGDFEDRAEAYQKAINSGWQSPAEVRKLENLPFIEGSDQLFINSTMVPINVAAAAHPDTPEAPASAPPAEPETEGLDPRAVRSVMGRLSRAASLEDIDPKALVAGLNGDSRQVLMEFDSAVASGEDVAEFRQRIRGLARRDEHLELLQLIATKEPAAPVVNVHVPEQSPPVVNVAAPEVHVAPPDVYVAPAEIRVDSPITVHVPKRGSQRIERDAHGNMARIVEEN